MSDKPNVEEEVGIIRELGRGALRGLGFILKAAMIALLFLVVQEFPEESKAVAVWTFESIRDVVLWAMARLSEVEVNPNVS